MRKSAIKDNVEEDTMRKRTILVWGLMLSLASVLAGTTSVCAQELSCTKCHDDTTLITGRATEWSKSMHGTGESYVRGTSSSCAGCHSGGGFSDMVMAGLHPNEVKQGDPHPTRQDCRACHQIHTSYTDADWALETTSPVLLYAFESVVFDGGKGNLCANCHQPRAAIATADPSGVINVTSTHWGPHHGPQSAMLLGQGGAGKVVGSPSAHAMLVTDTCVTCHMGESGNHTFEPGTDSCADCHGDTDDFDVEGLQTEVDVLIAQVRDLLIAKGLLDAEGHPVVGGYPAAQASALWNYIFIAIEDGSRGVHNPRYTKALLEAAVTALQQAA